jgi:hypothetical protein
MKFINILFLFFLIPSALYSDTKKDISIVYPKTENFGERDAYFIDLLDFILQKSGYSYTIKATKRKYTQARILRELDKGDNINLFWMGTSPEFEKRFLTLYYPLYRGLLGYRVFIIHQDNQKKFSKNTSLKELQQYVGVQGIGWSDIAILENAGLHQRSAKYENCFVLVERKRVDYFSRGFMEAFEEVKSRESIYPHLRVEKNITLVYPFAIFFFVSPHHKEILEALSRGFEKAYSDGSFERWFYKHPKIKDALVKSHLKERKSIEIDNPYMTEATKSIAAQYWHTNQK